MHHSNVWILVCGVVLVMCLFGGIWGYQSYQDHKRQVWVRMDLPWIVGMRQPDDNFAEVTVGFRRTYDEIVPFLVGYVDRDGVAWVCVSHRMNTYRVTMKIEPGCKIFALDAETKQQIVVKITKRNIDVSNQQDGDHVFAHSRIA